MSGSAFQLPSGRANTAGVLVPENVPAAICYAFDLIADLEAFNPLSTPLVSAAIVSGGVAPDDGLGGLFSWQPTNTLTPDGTSIIQPNGIAAGRWVRMSVQFGNFTSSALTSSGGSVDLGPNPSGQTWTLTQNGADLDISTSGPGLVNLGDGAPVAIMGSLSVAGQTTLQAVTIEGSGVLDGSLEVGGQTALQAVTATSIAGPLTGNATTASALQTARTVSLTGDVVASSTFDGSANLVLSTSLEVQGGLAAGTYAGLQVSAKGVVTGARALDTADITTALGHPAYTTDNPAGYVDAAQAAAAAPVQSVASRTGAVVLTTADLPDFNSRLTAAVGFSAGGDLGGVMPNPTVEAIGGHPVQIATPAANDLLLWNGSAFTNQKPVAIRAGALPGSTVAGSGLVTPLFQRISTVSGYAPGTADIAAGELVMNVPDGKLFLLKSGVGGTSVVDVMASIASAGAAQAPVQAVAGRTGSVVLGVSDVNGAAPLASPAFLGQPTAPTAAPGTSTAQLATTAFVEASVGAIAPIPTKSSQLTNDAGYVDAAQAAAAAPVQSVASRTGAVVIGIADVAGAAPLASPALIGNPTSVTPPLGDNSTSIATTAFVVAETSAALLTHTVTLTGDVTGVGSGSIAASLKNTGAPGSYGIVTTDPQGRVIGGSNPVTLAGYGISDGVRNAGGVVSWASGPAASIGAAGTEGRFYLSTDTMSFLFDTGTSWEVVQPAINGDISIPAGSSVATMPAINPNVGTYAGITVNAKGQVTGARALTGADINDALGFEAYSAANPAGFLLPSALNAYATLSSPALMGAPTAPSPPAGDNSNRLATTGWSTIAVEAALAAAAPTVFGGDVTGFTAVGTPNVTLNLKATGIAGSYRMVTTDPQGRVVGGSNPITLLGYGITDAVRNAGGAVSFQVGTDAAKGLAGTLGRFYVGIDTQAISYDNGSAWVSMQAAISGDISIPAGSSVATMPAINPNVGTYAGITVNAKGQVLGARPLSGQDIANALGYQPYSDANPAGFLLPSALNAYAPQNSPTFYGAPTAPTPPPGDNSTRLATTGWANIAIGAQLTAAIPTKVSQLTNDSSFVTLTGAAVASPVQTVANRTGNIVLSVSDVAGAAPAASPTFTGAPTAPTPPPGDNSTRLATTAFAAALTQNAVEALNPSLTFSGDATGSGFGSIVLTLKNTGTPGTYRTVTTDPGGRVISGSNPTTLAGYGIADAVRNLGGIATLQGGSQASRPAPGNLGAVYFESDTGVLTYDTGLAWEPFQAALTGDIFTAPNSSVATLPTLNQNPGTYAGQTVNGKGQVVASRQPTVSDIAGAAPLQTVTTTYPNAGTISATDNIALVDLANPGVMVLQSGNDGHEIFISSIGATVTLQARINGANASVTLNSAAVLVWTANISSWLSKVLN